jgi:hypothetical protein
VVEINWELEIDFHAGGMVLLCVALVLAGWSGVDYDLRDRLVAVRGRRGAKC